MLAHVREKYNQRHTKSKVRHNTTTKATVGKRNGNKVHRELTHSRLRCYREWMTAYCTSRRRRLVVSFSLNLCTVSNNKRPRTKRQKIGAQLEVINDHLKCCRSGRQATFWRALQRIARNLLKTAAAEVKPHPATRATRWECWLHELNNSNKNIIGLYLHRQL